MKEYFAVAELRALAADFTKLAGRIEEIEAKNEEKLRSKEPYPIIPVKILDEVNYILERVTSLVKYLVPNQPSKHLQ